MIEYRIRAYFKEVYPDRTYHNRIYTDLDTARRDLKKATNYYQQFNPKLRDDILVDRVVIEYRDSQWKELK